MTVLEIQSEPFASTGNISGEGFRKLLGRPALDMTKTVIRESFQNSIDAARKNSPPDILLRVRQLNQEQQKLLSERVFGRLPADEGSRKTILASLNKPDLRVMEIADFGTNGLAGPTRADRLPETSDEADFVNFMRNVGAARDVHHGGGTYGYGKTSLYAMSACSMIIADSETTNSGSRIRRIMPCHLGDAHEAILDGAVSRRFTGRHWWGVWKDGEIIDPVEDEEAVMLANGLGFPERKRGETGTTIMIIDPMLSNETVGSLKEDLLETIMWNFWPRMTESTPAEKFLKVRLEIDGTSVEIPTPENYPPLDLFSSALKRIRDGSDDVQNIRSQRPAENLGMLAIESGVCGTRSGGATRDNSIVPAQSSHIALMRPVELVVKYLEGEPYLDRKFEWAGVFVCSDQNKIEQAFASAEPPAHDDWVPDNLTKGDSKTYVNVALRELKSAARNFASPDEVIQQDRQKGESLAATSAIIGRLLRFDNGSSPGRLKRKTKPSNGRKTLSVSRPQFVKLDVDRDLNPIAIFSALVINDGLNSSLVIIAEPYLVSDGGATDAKGLPSNFEVSVSLMTLGEKRSKNSELEIGTREGVVEIYVNMPSDAAVGMRLYFQAGFS